MCRNTAIIQSHIITQRFNQNTVHSPSCQDWPNLFSVDSEYHLLRSLLTYILRCSDECGWKSDPWYRVLLLVLCCTATKHLQLQSMSDPWHSVVLLVLCIHLLECSRCSKSCCRWYFTTKMPYLSGLKTISCCPIALVLCKSVLSTAMLSSTAHKFMIQISSNNTTASTAAFILVQALQLLVQCTY